MKATTLTLAIALGCCAGAAFAEGDANTPFDPRWAAQEQQREAWAAQRQAEIDNPQLAIERGHAPPWAADMRGGLTDRDECWNPRAGHFEGVRPGDRQDDLDFSRCRPKRGYGRPYGWR
jgi:hypothetical protein